jgi:hypothetical protein
MAPMFIGATWAKLARRDELLCAPCVFDAARKGGIDLALADLLPCPFNLFDSPHSWFDLFLRGESRTRPNLSEWKAAGLGENRAARAEWLDEQEALRAAGQMSFDAFLA